VYLETSVIGYATSRPSRDLVVAARQQITRDWFPLRAPRYELFISQLVATEVAGGDEDAARERAAFLQGMARLRVTDAAGELAARLVASGTVPRTAAEDALHIAVAAVHGVDYLLTWNCNISQTRRCARQSKARAGRPGTSRPSSARLRS
jgi:predicted nucleic acid-binding protein